MFESIRLPGADGGALRFAIHREGSPVSYADVLQLWGADADFRSFFDAVLADSPFPAFRWETPPVCAASVDRPFEFALLDSPWLECAPDPLAFAEHFPHTEAGGVVAFSNLGRDAKLVVPTPVGPPSAYAHLGAFVRRAPGPQRHALWARVGTEVEARLGPKPLWVSTAGAGVAWLHVRIDDRPKYYGFRPFATRDKAGARSSWK